jgi:hypothetical protein
MDGEGSDLPALPADGGQGSDDRGGKDGGTSTAVIGGVIGAVVLLLLAVGLSLFVIWRHRKGSPSTTEGGEEFPTEPEAVLFDGEDEFVPLSCNAPDSLEDADSVSMLFAEEAVTPFLPF